MGTATSLITAEELLAMPDDGYRYDLIEGELHQMWPAGFLHGAIGADIQGHIWLHVKRNSLGRVFTAETGFRLESEPDTVLAPDVAFVAQMRLPDKLTVDGFFPGAPDLAVEVHSPGNSGAEIDYKIQRFLQHGTRLVWIVRPRIRVIEVHRLHREVQFLKLGDVLDGEDVLPGFRLSVSDLFTDD